MPFHGSLVELDLAVLLQHALGLACAAGSVDGKAGVVGLRLLEAALRLGMQDFLPDVTVQRQPAPAVGTNGVDPLGRVAVFHHCEGRAGLPDTEHGDKGSGASGQFDQHKVLFSEPFCREIGVDTGREFLRLPAGIIRPGELLRQKNRIGVLLHHFFPAFAHVGNSFQKIKFHFSQLPAFVSRRGSQRC